MPELKPYELTEEQITNAFYDEATADWTSLINHEFQGRRNVAHEAQKELLKWLTEHQQVDPVAYVLAVSVLETFAVKVLDKFATCMGPEGNIHWHDSVSENDIIDWLQKKGVKK